MSSNNLDKKIEQAKKHFRNINKSGFNNFQHFKYIELHDIIPCIREVCDTYGISTHFTIRRTPQGNEAILTVKDIDENQAREHTLPLCEIIEESNPGKYMQELGRIQTYSMRYLFIQAFEIAVPDEIDNTINEKTTTVTHDQPHIQQVYEQIKNTCNTKTKRKVFSKAKELRDNKKITQQDLQLIKNLIRNDNTLPGE